MTTEQVVFLAAAIVAVVFLVVYRRRIWIALTAVFLARRFDESPPAPPPAEIFGNPPGVTETTPSEEEARAWMDMEMETGPLPERSPPDLPKPKEQPARKFSRSIFGKRLLQPEWNKPTKDNNSHRVWFGTNRKPVDAADLSSGFTGQRSEKITFGHVDVIVPTGHRFGEIGTSFWTKVKRWDFRDDRLRIDEIEGLSAEQMWGELRTEMEWARELGDPADALIFLHGYANSFEDAAIRAGQIHVDLGVTGATAFFSWPSRGAVQDYLPDGATIEASEEAITSFLVAFAKNSGATKVHIIAHSMGNRGLLRTLQRIAGDAEARSGLRFGQIFLAAPDVDRDLFIGLARLYPAFSDRTTLYASNADFAVWLSSKANKAPRAGYFLPYTVAPGIDTIAVPDFDVDLLGHGYFAQAAPLLYDIHELMRNNTPPRSRLRVEKFEAGPELLWRLRL